LFRDYLQAFVKGTRVLSFRNLESRGGNLSFCVIAGWEAELLEQSQDSAAKMNAGQVDADGQVVITVSDLERILPQVLIEF
jgi:hypothetical protein